MKRRQFITLLGGVAVSWPRTVRAQQQPSRMQRIGVLSYWASNNRQGQAGLAAFKEVLQQSGWTEGVNIQFETRWSADSTEQARKFAAELIALVPDVILSSTTPSTQALQSLTRTLPIVFVTVADPVGVGIVQSLARPGGNITGFMNFEYSVSGKWLELLKQIMPALTRVAVLRDASNPAAIGQFSSIQAAAQPRAIELQAVNVRDAGEIEQALAEFARTPNGGLIVTPAAGQSPQRDLILELAVKFKLPAVYSDRELVTAGGLIAFGPDRIDQFRHAAGYVDRILKGAKPADLPVQVPTKYEMAINLRTAKTLGLDMPPSLLATADEVIE